jgi:hypothetical protein
MLSSSGKILSYRQSTDMESHGNLFNGTHDNKALKDCIRKMDLQQNDTQSFGQILKADGFRSTVSAIAQKSVTSMLRHTAALWKIYETKTCSL